MTAERERWYASGWERVEDDDLRRRRPDHEPPRWEPGRRPLVDGHAPHRRPPEERIPGKRTRVEAELEGPAPGGERVPGKVTRVQRASLDAARIAARGHDHRGPEVGGDDRREVLEEVVERARRAGGGSALPGAVATRLADELGHPVAHARIHEDAEAAELASILGVRAFALGGDIYFGAGEYAPGTDGGDRLLRHELTHVAQHDRGELSGGGIEMAAESSHVEVEARAREDRPRHAVVSAPASSPSPSPASSPVSARSAPPAPSAPSADTVAAARKAAPVAEAQPLATVVDLLGQSTFEPTADVAEHIAKGGKQGAPVRVRFGRLSTGGIIRVRKSGKRYVTVEDKPQLVPLSHPLFAAVPGFSPVLRVRIGASSANSITGHAALSEKLVQAGAIAKFLAENPAALGLLGFELPSLRITNELAGGAFTFSLAKPVAFELGGWVHGTMTFGVVNDVVTFEAGADLDVKGLAQGSLDIRRNERGQITGEATLTAQLGDRFSGSATARYENGDVAVRGKLRYESEKLKGEMNVVVDEVDKAEQVVKGAIDPMGLLQVSASDAPEASGAPAKAKKSKKGARGVAGYGSLDFAFTDWLTGKALVAYGPTGYITVLGKIAPPNRLDIMSKPEGFTRPLFDPIKIEAHYGLPHIADAHVGISVGMSATANVGPIYMADLAVEGVYSTDPSVLNAFSITGALRAQAYAGLTLDVRGYGGLSIAGHDVNVGAGIKGEAGIKAYAEARPTLGYREVADPTAGKKGEYYLKGHLEMAAQPVLGLGGYLFVELDSPWWSPAPDKTWTWPIGNLEYPLGGSMGVAADMDYVIGSGKWPTVTLSDAAFNPDKFVDSMMDEELPAKGGAAGEQNKGGTWKQAPVPPPTAPPAPKVEPPAPAAKAPPRGGTRKKGTGGQSPDERKNVPHSPDVAERWAAGMKALGEVRKRAESDPLSSAEIQKQLADLKARHGFASLAAERGGEHWLVDASMNPSAKDIKIKAEPEKPDATKDGKADAAKAGAAGQPEETMAQKEERLRQAVAAVKDVTRGKRQLGSVLRDRLDDIQRQYRLTTLTATKLSGEAETYAIHAVVNPKMDFEVFDVADHAQALRERIAAEFEEERRSWWVKGERDAKKFSKDKERIRAWVPKVLAELKKAGAAYAGRSYELRWIDLPDRLTLMLEETKDDFNPVPVGAFVYIDEYVAGDWPAGAKQRVYQKRSDPDTDYVKDSLDQYVPRYVIRNITPADLANINRGQPLEPRGGPRAKGVTPLEHSMGHVNSSLIATTKQQDGDVHLPIDDGTGNPQSFASPAVPAGKQRIKIDLAKIEADRITDLSTRKAQDDLSFSGPTPSPTNTPGKREQALRDVVRTSEVAIDGGVPPEAIVEFLP